MAAAVAYFLVARWALRPADAAEVHRKSNRIVQRQAAPKATP